MRWVVILVSIILFAKLTFWLLGLIEDKKYVNEGKNLIEKVEEYQAKNGVLPSSMQELDIVEMGDGPYYKKIDSANYLIYFTIGFDDVKVYDNKTKKWRYDKSIQSALSPDQ